jgi:guanosine-3',5'-bis(diphosphate) 3'-pyrophosphohydrolase
MISSGLTSSKVRLARSFVISAHGEQKYGDEFPYILHLTLVEGVLLRFGIVDEDLRVAGLCHDVLEDTDHTFDELVTLFGPRVANAVAALTEPKGGNRKWRHELTYPRIRENPDAIIVKLADRIANVEAGGRLVSMYVREHPEFRKWVYREDSPQVVQDMWNYLSELLVQAAALSRPTVSDIAPAGPTVSGAA